MAAVTRAKFSQLLQPGLAKTFYTMEERIRRTVKGECCESCGAPPTQEFPVCGYCGSDWGWKYVPHNYPMPEEL